MTRNSIENSSSSLPATSPGSALRDRVMRPHRNVGVIANFSYSGGRDVLQGVSSYALTANWRLFKFVRPEAELYNELQEWNADGIIVDEESYFIREQLARFGAPVVCVGRMPDGGHLPAVFSDGHAVGRMAAAHFLERGFHSFAAVGRQNAVYSTQRIDGYLEVLHKRGLPHSVFDKDLMGADLTYRYSRQSMAELKSWLIGLPRPTGIFCVDDMLGESVMNAATDVGRHVPEDFAVLGVSNDSLICDLTTPPLSSLDINVTGCGYQAAVMLDQLMSGLPLPQPTTVWLPPKGIVVRASTDLLAIRDQSVGDAVRYIRTNVSRAVTVEDVLTVVPVSRRPLERKFKEQLNRTILDEIHRSRIERAKSLLVSTDLPIKEIALDSGYQTPTHLCVIFRKLTRITPREYRREFQHMRLLNPRRDFSVPPLV